MMEMAKSLFFNIPMYGHAAPTFGVVAELVDRGEEVTYYLTDDFAAAISATGATFERYESTLKDWRPRGRFSRLLVEECQYVVPQVIERVRASQPDYIIYEANCLWGRLLAGLFHVPTISCQASLAVNKHFSHISQLLGGSRRNDFSPTPFQLLIETLNDLAPLADLCATYDLPGPEQNPETLFFPAEDLNIVFASRLLQPAGETFDERFVFVGPSFDPGQMLSTPFEVRLSDSTSPLLYISLGTIYNVQPDFYRLCFQAFGKQRYRVIAALGKDISEAELGSAPENFLLCSFVPQIAVLQQADVFVTHGGLNSITEALSCGVPMVIIPQMPEQMITARRLVDLGLAIVLDKERLTPEALRNAVQTLLNDPGLRTRMRQAQEEVQASGGAKRAADAILQFVSRKRPSGEL
jgi:MGT family glycosyltransferase